MTDAAAQWNWYVRDADSGNSWYLAHTTTDGGFTPWIKDARVFPTREAALEVARRIPFTVVTAEPRL